MTGGVAPFAPSVGLAFTHDGWDGTEENYSDFLALEPATAVT